MKFSARFWAWINGGQRKHLEAKAVFDAERSEVIARWGIWRENFAGKVFSPSDLAEPYHALKARGVYVGGFVDFVQDNVDGYPGGHPSRRVR